MIKMTTTMTTMAVLQENALLRAEVQDLRQANEILSQRRRIKKTRLQQRGVITIEEGRQAVDQMNGDGHVEGESSRSSRQRRPVLPGVRRSGVSDKTGHNARRYQIVVSVSGEECSD